MTGLSYTSTARKFALREMPIERSRLAGSPRPERNSETLDVRLRDVWARHSVYEWVIKMGHTKKYARETRGVTRELVERFGDWVPDEIDLHLLRDFILAQKTQPMRFLYQKGVVKTFEWLRYLGASKKIDPLEGWRVKRPTRRAPKGHITDEELDELVNNPDLPDIHRGIIWLLAETGARCSEIAGVRCMDVYQRPDGMYVVRTTISKTGRIEFVERLVSRRTYEVLEDLKDGREDGALLFTPPWDREKTRKNAPVKFISDMIKEAVQITWGDNAEQLSRVTPHAFRHAYARRLYLGGADIWTIKELLNHRSVSSTAAYLSRIPTAIEEAHRRIILKDLKADPDKEKKRKRGKKPRPVVRRAPKPAPEPVPRPAPRYAVIAWKPGEADFIRIAEFADRKCARGFMNRLLAYNRGETDMPPCTWELLYTGHLRRFSKIGILNLKRGWIRPLITV